MKALIGLGNPGREYELSRHNAGFIVADNLVEIYGGNWSNTRFTGVAARTNIRNNPLMSAKPLTYMNRSGHFVSSFLNYYRIETEDMLVVHDEMDLPLGRLRLSRGGSAAGHRGVESIISQLGANDFARLRVGVGKPISKAGVVKHVLSRFDDEDMSLFSRIIEVCVKAIETWIDDGLEAAMNLYNGTHLQLNESEEGD